MRDGIRLSTHAYLHPGDAEPLPVLLFRSMYGKGTFEVEARLLAAGGYVSIVQDVRGLFESEGEIVELWDQGPDCFDVVAWIREQPFCNGKVAMWGASYNGLIQWMTANEGTRLDALAPTASWILKPERLNFEQMDFPAQHSVGYYDFLCRGAIYNFQQMQRHSATPHSRENQQLLFGPWSHATGYPKAGDVDFGEIAEMDSGYSGRVTQHLRFFDHHLKGLNPDQHFPAVRYFMMGENQWYTAGTWPPENSELKPVYLHSDGHANTRHGDGRLEYEPPPRDQPHDMFISDPADPVPTAPGRGNKFIEQFMPFDQQLLHTRQDVLVYTTPPLEDPVQFAGHVRAELFVSTDHPGANVVVKLLDLHPDGFAHTLRDGALYLHVNETRLPHEPLQPGAVRHVTIDMGHAAARIDRGHRLCVQVAGTNAPIHYALIGEEYGISSSQVMTQKVYHSRKHPSRVLLPMLKKGEGR